MANTIQLKRRISGLAGAPAALKSGELAHNEVDDTLYVGKGDDGGGNATSIVPLAGKGALVDLASAQSIAGAKTFSLVPKSSQDASAANDLVRKSQMDAGLATKAALAHTHAIGDVTGLQTALDAKLGTAANAVSASKLPSHLKPVTAVIARSVTTPTPLRSRGSTLGRLTRAPVPPSHGCQSKPRLANPAPREH